MTKKVIYLGLNDSKKMKQLISTKKALKTITNLVVHTFGAGTISIVNGIYTYEKNNKTIKEKTIKIELLTEKNIKGFVLDLKGIFNQELVLIENYNIEYNFI